MSLDIETSELKILQQTTNGLIGKASQKVRGSTKTLEVAWLTYNNQLYWAYADSQPQMAFSCVTLLIQELFQQHKDLSFFLLRQRIFTNRQITEMDTGMVRLAAKRISVLPALDNKEQASQISGALEICINDQATQVWGAAAPKEGLQTEFPESFSSPFDFLKSLVAQIPRGPVLHDYNREIAAVLVSAEGKPLIAATNLNAINKTLHAEVRCLQFYINQMQQKIQPGSKLYVTLKPCRMCAGMLSEVLEKPEDIQVIYLQDDPGKLAQGSSLEKQGRFRPFIAD